jgi:histidinol dehydrogenase
MTAAIAIRRLNAADQSFAQHLDHLLSWESVSDDAVNHRVLDIKLCVSVAILQWSVHQRFDGLDVFSMAGSDHRVSAWN